MALDIEVVAKLLMDKQSLAAAATQIQADLSRRPIPINVTVAEVKSAIAEANKSADSLNPMKGSSWSGYLKTGMAMGAATAGILILADAIKEAINQSKILSAITKQVFTALGLLIDLILLPFLPLLVGAIAGLYDAILWFGGIWENMFPDGIPEWGSPPADWAAFFADIQNLPYKLADATIGELGRMIGNKIGEWIKANIADPVYDTAVKWWKAGEITWYQWVTAFWMTVDQWKAKLGEIWTSITSAYETVANAFHFNFVNPLLAAWESLVNGIKGFINHIIDAWNLIPGVQQVDKMSVSSSFMTVGTGDNQILVRKPFRSADVQTSTIAPQTTVTNVVVRGNIIDDGTNWIDRVLLKKGGGFQW